VLPHQDAEYIRHIAIDIGGSLIKLVYFSPEEVADNGGDANGHRHNTGGTYQHLHSPCALLSALLHAAKLAAARCVVGCGGIMTSVCAWSAGRCM
jgi:hypothetical protein